MPTPTQEQSRVIDGVYRRFTSGISSSVAGLAGTGKTFLISEVYQKCAQSSLFDRVLVLAPTGKATEVLKKKGIPARTVHSVAFNFKGYTKDERPIFAKKQNGKFACVVLIDESSMVDRTMYENLLSRGFPMCWFGDPGQLPPVQSAPTGILDNPTYELTQIHRQREGNPIIDFAYCIREGVKRITDYHPGIHQVDSERLTCEAVANECLSRSVDILICWKNRQRVRLNQAFRKVMGYSTEVQAGDKVICLNNNAELEIYNGQIFEVLSVEGSNDTTIIAKIIDVDRIGRPLSVAMERSQFNRETTQPKQEDTGELFDFAYCLTGHKSQGSQWKHVGVIGPQPLPSWQYTVATRPESDLTVFY